MSTLRVIGAAEHNLAGVDVEIPLGQWTAVTGPSGSGKTSLVFDTIVAESQWRYLATLSARARHYLGSLSRPRVQALEGLPVAIAVGASSTAGHVRSTVGTLTGTLDVLRLLFARAAEDPRGEPLTRSHFSFNHPVGACEACQGIGVADQVDPARLVADPSKSIRDGALVPTLKNGYTVYSQVTLDVMDQICQAHGFSVQVPWQDLTDAQREVVFFGTRALEVPFGKHSIESRMRWKGITARPRQEGYYRGLIPVIEETLARNRNPGVLRFVRSVPCEACGGSRLSRAGREARLGPTTLPQLLGTPVGELDAHLDAVPSSPVWEALRPSLAAPLARMRRLGLGHLALDRLSTTLSGGEAQRIRLAAQLGAGLSGMLVALDEPTLGLHPEGQPGMAEILEEMLALGNTVLTVEHDPDMVRHADRVIAVGPGAGPQGGRVTSEGIGPDDPLGGPPALNQSRAAAGASWIELRGATLHNLQAATLRIRGGALNVVMGPSGAGKSSLVFGTLLPALSGVSGGPFATLEGATQGSVRALDARPIGRTPRSTPATFSGVFDLVRARFAETPLARERGYGAGRFSYNNKEGRCPTCEGLGVERIGLHLLARAEVTCSACQGDRYAPDTLAVHYRDVTIADVLRMTVAQARGFFDDDPPIAALCRAMDELGLGYLALGQSSASLSRGEAQRVKLATLLGRPASEPTLLLLDEPDRGLHPDDIARLLAALRGLTAAGHTVVAISHHRHLWAAADHLTEVREGAAREVTQAPLRRLSSRRPARAPCDAASTLALRGITVHNLTELDVDLPHDAIVALAGVSGSGKSSLAFHTIASEAWHRFGESLPFAARRFVRRLPRPSLASVSGLRPTVALRQGQARAPRRSTVATQSELGPLLRTLWSRAGAVDDEPGGLTAEHFSPDRPLGACPACEGLGVVQRARPELLVTDPARPLADGAFAGTRAGRFFTEPDGQYVATIRAALPGVDLDAPWQALSTDAQKVILHGAGERRLSVTWRFKRGKREGEHSFEGTFDGLLALVEGEARRRAQSKQASQWAAALRDEPCEACGGARLAPAVARVQVGTLTLPQAQQLPLRDLATQLDALTLTEPRRQAAVDALRPEIHARLEDLIGLGLEHLSLGRRSRTLSEGELQRVRLAGVLRSGLTGMTIVLDEPGAGLHPAEIDVLLQRLRRLRDAGNTVLVVAHRPELLRAADHLVELGPGAGPHGGRIVAHGSTAGVLAGPGKTAAALREPPKPRVRETGAARIEIVGAHAHNLAAIDVSIPASGFVAVTGVSGSGKSSLVFDVLEASARAGGPVACARVEGLDRYREIRSARASTTSATVLGALGLMPALQKLLAGITKAHGLPKQAVSFASPAGRCETCKGSGTQEVAMDILADLALPCPACGGRRYRPEVLALRWEGLAIDELLALAVSDVRAHLPESAESGPLPDAARALERVGLGHLGLSRACNALSGGERQRLTLAASLLGAPTPSLYLLDEPATGLHEADLAMLVDVFHELADRGDLVVAAEHRTSLVAAADWVLDLGPGSGERGGTVVEAGKPSDLRHGLTAASLQRTAPQR